MIDLQDIRGALTSADEETRRSALHSLRNCDVPEKQTLLFTAMGDESWRVRKEAVESYLHSNPDPDSVKLLLELLRNQDNAGLRNSAAEAVIRLGSVCAAPLITMIDDPDADVRKFIIDIMGAIGAPVFVPSLLHSLHDPEVNVASAAAEQLGALGDGEAAEYLMQALFLRDEVLFRHSTLVALGILAKPVAIPYELIQLADMEILRKAVFDCLGAISDDSSLELLLNGLSSRQKNCRSAALKALYNIYRRSSPMARRKFQDALLLCREHDVIIGLLDLFDSHDGVLAEALLWASAMTRDSRFIPLIIEAYADERTANTALSTLKNFGQEALNNMIPRYSTLDENGKSVLCILIGECGYSEFNTILQDALHDPSAKVRIAAATTVGILGLTASIPDLFLLIDDNESSVYTAAVTSLQALVRISPGVISTEVAHFCSSRKSQHRKAAAQLLATLGEPDRLLHLLNDEDHEVRKAAVSAVGVNRIESSGSMLVSALLDESPDVRIAVADALGNLRDPETLDALEHALNNDDDVWVQSSILKAITKIELTRVLPIIKSIHSKAEGLLMITIIKTCEEINTPESELIIRDALKSSDPDIARQAALSLEHISN